MVPSPFVPGVKLEASGCRGMEVMKGELWMNGCGGVEVYMVQDGLIVGETGDVLL